MDSPNPTTTSVEPTGAVGGAVIVPVLSGGGTRFPTHVGVLRALGELGVGFHRLVGLSGGSIVAALYAAGFGAEKIEQWTCETDFRKLVRFTPPRLLFRGGMCSGKVFEEWMDERLSGVTFSELELDLVIVATDIRHRRPVIFSRATTPDVRVARAVRFSTAIPVLFDYQLYGEAVLVDGEILATETLVAESKQGDTPAFAFEVEGAIRPPSTSSRRFRLSDYFGLLADTFTYATSSRRLGPWAWNHTILIDVGMVPPVKLNLSGEEKRQLAKSGYETTMHVLPVKLRSHYRRASEDREEAAPSLSPPLRAQPPCAPHSSGHGKAGKR